MSGLDANKLAELQKRWSRFVACAPERIIGNMHMPREITDELTSMRLDMDDDATYELLAPGLTRKEFLQKQAEPIVLRVIDSFNASQRMSGSNYLAELCFRQFYGLKQLVQHDLPEYEANVLAAGITVTLNEIQSSQLALVRDLAQRGVLTQQMKKAANDCAIERFRIVHEAHMKLQDPKQKINGEELRRAIDAARDALEHIEIADDCHQPGLVPAGYTMWGNFNNQMVQFDRATIESCRQAFVVRECGSLFEHAVQFQAKGHFVLDFSGSGHGAMDLPMQRILEQLQDNGLDPRDKAVFTRMGVAEADFWTAYAAERQAVAHNQQYSGLMKSEFKRQP